MLPPGRKVTPYLKERDDGQATFALEIVQLHADSLLSSSLLLLSSHTSSPLRPSQHPLPLSTQIRLNVLLYSD
jgi:hypothetical protein